MKAKPMPNNQDVVKLLPCPFTGNHARVECSREDCFYVVSGGAAQVEGPVAKTEAEAIRLWNTRVPTRAKKVPTPREQELEAALVKAKVALLQGGNANLMGEAGATGQVALEAINQVEKV
jgi:hypothetical protein